MIRGEVDKDSGSVRFSGFYYGSNSSGFSCKVFFSLFEFYVCLFVGILYFGIRRFSRWELLLVFFSCVNWV